MTNAPVRAVIDTHYEDFDDREDNTTIDGVETWSVSQGNTSNAVTQDTITFKGSGKSLELIGAETNVNVSNTKSFEQISPTWIEFIIKAGKGGQTQDVPEDTIAAVTFDLTGKIYASDGSSWKDTGETFTTDDWYRVTLKVDFSTHLYDIYISPVATPELSFIADKENLAFVDTSINSVSQLNFGGVYHSTLADDSYIDDLVIHFINSLGIISAPQTITKGQPSGPITVQLQNSLIEPQTAWQDIRLELNSTSEGSEFSLDKKEWAPINEVTIAEGAQGITFYYKDTKSGKPIISVREYPDRGWQEALQQEEVVSEIANFEVAVTTPHVAGEYFEVMITAKDDEGNVDETYGSEVEIDAVYVSPESGTRNITPETASGFSEGILKLQVLYPDCGTIQIRVSDEDDISKTGTSGAILFIPAGLTVTCDSPQVAGSAFPLTVTAYIAGGAIEGGEGGLVALNYKGPAALEIIPVLPKDTLGGALTPSTLSAENFSDGAAEKDIAYDRWGTIKIKAYDKDHPAKSGTSGEISFLPHSVLIDVVAPSEKRNFFYVGENIEVVVTVADASKEAIANYLGNIILSSTVGLSVPEGHQFVAADEGKYSFITSADSAGDYKVSAVEKESELAAQSPTIVVKKVYLQVVNTEAPIGSTEVAVQLVDEDNNLITTESGLTVNIELEEELVNSTASSPGILTPSFFKDGIAKFIVSNTEAEDVIITPKSRYKFEIKKGTVKFGKISKKGIGVLMWRELKEKEKEKQ